jgi:alpha-glucosidase
MTFYRCKYVAACATALLALAVATARGESLDLTVGRTPVRATAISPTVFRLSVGPEGGTAGPRSSTFVDADLHPGDVGRRGPAAAGHQRLTTDAGALDVDTAAGTWSLLDAHGVVLTPPAPIAARSGTADKPALDLKVGWPADRPFAVYGCGNGATSLVQHKVSAQVRNRVVVQPYFWAPAGFGTLVVGADDDAPAQCDGKIDGDAVTWSVPGASADLYLFVAPTLSDSTHALLWLTGRPPVPPRWTMGYLQSRWGWVDKAYIDDALHQFLSRKLPVDAFIFDFEWYTTTPDYKVPPDGTAGFTDFGFNPKLFPDPVEQIKQFHDAGVHVVGIRKPRLANADTLVMVRQKHWDFPASATGTDARALRFANPDARAWYAAQTVPLLKDGIDGWWNDEGEFSYTNFYYWNVAQRAAEDAVQPSARMWTINRAFSPGMGRLGAAAWTGDIHATWQDLQRTPTSLLNWGLAGMPFAGCDIGGYRGEDTPELLVRWMQAGTFFPIMRAHSQRPVKPRFPWLWGDEAEGAMRKTLDLRYQLVPVLYSLAHQTYETGEPTMRPLCMQYPADPRAADLSDEWLVGRDLLAAPVLAEGGHRRVYLPDDVWYDFATGERVAGGRELDRDVPLDAVPLYVRAGSILTLGPVIQHTRDLPGGPLDVHVYPGRDGAFTLVEDDGATTAYASGNVRRTAFAWDDVRRVLSWTQTGPYAGNDCFRTLRITVHGGRNATAVERPLSTAGKVSLRDEG